jgi:hypothetical protein
MQFAREAASRVVLLEHRRIVEEAAAEEFSVGQGLSAPDNFSSASTG